MSLGFHEINYILTCIMTISVFPHNIPWRNGSISKTACGLKFVGYEEKLASRKTIVSSTYFVSLKISTWGGFSFHKQ